MVRVDHVRTEFVHGVGGQARRRNWNWKFAAVEMLDRRHAHDVCIVGAGIFRFRGNDQRLVIAAAVFFVKRHHTTGDAAEHGRIRIGQHQYPHGWPLLLLVSSIYECKPRARSRIAVRKLLRRFEMRREKPHWLGIGRIGHYFGSRTPAVVSSWRCAAISRRKMRRSASYPRSFGSSMFSKYQ